MAGAAHQHDVEDRIGEGAGEILRHQPDDAAGGDAAQRRLQQAGADVALWITTDGIPDVLDKLEAAAKAGQLDQAQIDKSVLRVAAMKGPGAKCVK